MPRPWQPGLGRRSLLLGLSAMALFGVGWAFGTRLLAIRGTWTDLCSMTAEEERAHDAILALRQKLAAASLPAIVEQEARRQLRWGFPSEERIVLIWR